MSVRYQRVLLKISGEALMGDQSFGQDLHTIRTICQEIKAVHNLGVEIVVVVGGGNIFRGMKGAAEGMERASADYMGMLATVLNALALQNMLESMQIDTRVLSAITMMEVCEPFIRRRAIRHLERGRVVICAAGTGNPFFTTDTAAALRAIELQCDAMLKGTQVDGVYTDDPKKNPQAKRYERLSYTDVLAQNLKVMDASAIALARDNQMPILVMSIQTPGAFAEAIQGRGVYTIVEE